MEVVAVVGEAVMSYALSTILDKLASSDLLTFARQEKVLAEIKKWKSKLLNIYAVLEDAEEKQVKREPVKNWLRNLRDLAYDVEDILDEFNTEALRRNLTADPQASTSKVRTLVTCCFTSLNPGAVTFNARMGSKLEKITARLEEIVKEKNDLDLKENVGGISRRTTESVPTTSLVGDSRVLGRGRDTTSLLGKSRVFGRERDEEAIVKLLQGDDEASNDAFSVIAIVGMGGLGKTTLAQRAYNDDRVKACFGLKAWVCVSEDFNIIRITKTILQSFTSEYCDDKSLNWLQVKLEEKLSKQKVLIVLDDVRNENKSEWENLCKPFSTGVAGCKLIVTTRNNGVVSTMGHAVSAYHLPMLSDEECLSLLEKCALGTRSFDQFPNLKDVGMEIAKKCKGLPLAAKTLGGLLCTKQNCEEWEGVLKSKIWELPEKNNDILPALKLSYHYLPSHLKRCFAYCSIFPKDYEFDKMELALLWMAEGFLHQPKETKQMEDLGCEYFDNLLSMSFFQQSGANESRYVMHDLINDLAQFVAEEVCFRLEVVMESSHQLQLSEKTRHLSFIPRQFEVSKRFEVFTDVKHLRTFLSLPIDRRGNNFLSNKVVYHLLPKVNCLRALSLSGYSISELPNSIGNLKHLRYLNLSLSTITRLPDSVSVLYNLQTLILQSCSRLVELPAGIKNLLDLHHLDITGTKELQKMPSQIGNLTRLRILPKFIVGKDDELQIHELKTLSHLQGQLSIYGLDNVREVQDARVANLKEKPGLDELALQWSDEFHDSRNEDDEKQVLNSLQPHQNLQKLKITSYGGKDFPSWVGNHLFANMVDITLAGCRKSKSLPSLGRLPLLKHLYIYSMDGVESVGGEFYGGCIKPFPVLETLVFAGMLGWEEWSCYSSVEDEAEGVFPHLCTLEIRNCPKLIGKLPSHLPSLVILNVYQCPLLSDSIEKLPSLHEVEIEECNEVVVSNAFDFTSLTTIQLSRISALSCLGVSLMQKLVALEALEIKDCSELKCLWQNGAELEKLVCLRSLVINKCSQLVSLIGEEEGLLPCNLEALNLEDCGILEKLPSGLHSLTCLRSLTIKSCPKLISFPETCWPYTLRNLSIQDCEALKSLPDGMMMHDDSSNQSLLEELTIYKCPCLKSFPSGKLPTTLKKLEIIDCKNLESLPEGMMHDDSDGNRTCHLEELAISGCLSLTFFPTGEFPATLKILEIGNGTELNSFFRRFLMGWLSLSWNIRNLPLECLQSLTYLSHLYMYGCGALESFPERGFSIPYLSHLYIYNCGALESFPERGFSIPNLKSFKIENCENLKSLPSEMHNLTSLETFYISECPGIVSFPTGGLPPNLTLLEISYCENLKQSMTEWGLNTLTSLTCFNIRGACPATGMVSFPDDDCRTLPTTLIELTIYDFENLESLSRGFQNLPSLRELLIGHCPKIRSLPKEGLPASLEHLHIKNCPLLEQRCLKEKGDYWRTIAHIPYIVIDENHIQ